MIDKALYDELVDLFATAGGAYRTIDPPLFDYLIECLELGQFYLERDDAGQIATFAMYWWIDPSEQQVALKYQRPSDIVRGASLWMVDCVNKGGRQTMHRMIADLRNIAPSSLKGVAWAHRNSRQLRYFPSQRGEQ